MVGCHCAAAAGLMVAKSVSPAIACAPEQKGQPVPRLRSATIADHSCDRSQAHQAILFELVVTMNVVTSPFFVGCH